MSGQEWTDDVERVLELIRQNSVLLTTFHKKKYYEYKGYLKYFKLPMIVLASITSIASMGLTNYMKQEDISLLTCLLSLGSALIASIELYLGIQKSMEMELNASKNYLILSYDIYKTTQLDRGHRVENGRQFLDEKYNTYVKLIENSKICRDKKYQDQLAPLPINIKPIDTPTSSKENFGLELKELGDIENDKPKNTLNNNN